MHRPITKIQDGGGRHIQF